MKNMFTRPEECFSRQEATSIFRSKGMNGPIDVGTARLPDGIFSAWHCYSDNRHYAFSIFKKQASKDFSGFSYFLNFGIEEIFLEEGNFYYIDSQGELLRIDIFSDTNIASNVYEILTDTRVNEIGLRLLSPNFASDDEPLCRWLINGNKFLPVFKQDFSQIANYAFHTAKLLQPGDIFKHNRMLWEVKQDGQGLEISPLCIETSKNRNPWSNIS